MSSFRGHLKTITAHKLCVMHYCFRAGLYRQGLLHDMSKYSPAEFWAGVKYYQGDRSPNQAERLERGYSAAWLHHKGRNKHHLEYWIDCDPERGFQLGGVEMPEKYVAEMFCDRVAACRIYQKEKYTDASPWEYYAVSRDRNVIHPNTRALLEKLLLMLRDEGEDAALAYIRKNLRK